MSTVTIQSGGDALRVLLLASGNLVLAPDRVIIGDAQAGQALPVISILTDQEQEVSGAFAHEHAISYESVVWLIAHDSTSRQARAQIADIRAWVGRLRGVVPDGRVNWVTVADGPSEPEPNELNFYECILVVHMRYELNKEKA